MSEKEFIGNAGEDQESDVITQEKKKVERPNLYRIVLLNDDYTPQEFVVWLLRKIFYKSEEESIQIMLDTHTKGRGVVGIYTHDVAKTKVIEVVNIARKHEHPLECIMEVESAGGK